MEKVPVRRPKKRPYSMHTYQIQDLCMEQIVQMGRLSRRGGLLSIDFTTLLKMKREGKKIPWHRIIIAENKKGKIFGWGLMQVDARRRKQPISNVWMMYVQHAFRRNGIGKCLAKKAYSMHFREFWRRNLYIYVAKDQGGFYKKIGVL